MSKNSLLITLGVLTILSSFLGVPGSWKTAIFSVLGLLIVIVAVFLRKDIASGSLCTHLQEEKRTDSYTQNGALRHNGIHTHEDTRNDTAPQA